MKKQLNVSNIKSIMYLENDFEQIFNEYDNDDEIAYYSTITNVTSLTYDDTSKTFVVKSDDFNHTIDIDDDNIYIAKINENKHDDFDEYAKSLHAINATFVNIANNAILKSFMFNNNIKSIETKNDDETETQSLYVIDNDNNKYIVFNDDDDMLLYSKHEYDEFSFLCD